MIRRFALALVVCLVMLVPALKAFSQAASQPEAAPGAVKLEYKFTPGDEYRSKMVMDIDMDMSGQIPGAAAGSMPKMTIKTVMVFKTKITKVLPNGDAEISQQIESMKMDMMGQTRNVPLDKMPNFTIVMSPNGAVKSIKGMEEFSKLPTSFMSMNGMGEFGGVLPLNAVKTGDTWSQELPMPMGSGKIKMDSVLLDANSKLGKYNVAVIKEKVIGDFDMSSLMQSAAGANSSSQPAPKISGHLSTDGKVYFSSEKGRLVRAECTGNVQMAMVMSAPDASGNMVEHPVNMSIPMKMEMFILP